MPDKKLGPAPFDPRHFQFVRQSGLTRRDLGERDWDSIGDRAVLIVCLAVAALLLSGFIV